MKRTITLLSIFFTIWILFSESISFAQLSTGTWAGEVYESGEPERRHENGFIEIGDKFYLLGSRGNRRVDIYDPATKIWTRGANPPIPLHHFQAVSYDNKVYVMGAFTGDYPTETPVPNVYIYDPAANQWTQGPEIPAERRRGSAGVVNQNNKLYMVAGAINGHTDGHVTWLDEYDPANGTWTQLPDAPRARDHFAASISNNKIYVAGGRRSSYPNTFGLTVPEVDIYDFTTQTWTTHDKNLPTQRGGTTTATLAGHVIVIGGESTSQMEAHSEVEALNVSSGDWTTLNPLTQGRHGTQAIVYNDKIFVVAGSSSRGGSWATELTHMESFSFTRDGNEDDDDDDEVDVTSPMAKNDHRFEIFPNPFTNKIYVKFSNSYNSFDDINLYNSIGVNLDNVIFRPLSEGLYEADMSELHQGIYYLKIFNKTSKVYETMKIIKSH
jgi:hypothetical protein